MGGVPAPSVMDVVKAALQEEHSRPRPTEASSTAAAAAADTSPELVVGGMAGSGVTNREERPAAVVKPEGGAQPSSNTPSSTASKPASGSTAGGSSGGGGSDGALKGKVVFTPIYGCDEGATGVGPVCSILEVGGISTATKILLVRNVFWTLNVFCVFSVGVTTRYRYLILHFRIKPGSPRKTGT